MCRGWLAACTALLTPRLSPRPRRTAWESGWDRGARARMGRQTAAAAKQIPVLHIWIVDGVALRVEGEPPDDEFGDERALLRHLLLVQSLW